MKKSLLLSIGLLLTIFVLSNFTSNHSQSKSFVFTSMNEEPILPDVPYDYADIEIPEHLLSMDFFLDSTGLYRPAGIDPGLFSDIDNNKATLGRVLFYDKKLSAMEDISCASCHDQKHAFADPVQFSEGTNEDTRRNSMHLVDLAWTTNTDFFWDMSVSSFEEVVKLPLKDNNEIGADLFVMIDKMNETTYYPELFQNAFYTYTINEERIAEAITHFLRSINSFDTKFDMHANNNFSTFNEQESLGSELFNANCSTCHVSGSGISSIFGGPVTITNTTFQQSPFTHSNGLPIDEDDRGAGEWAPGFEDLYKIPSLRNISFTAPYMHDGRFETLEEVIDFYSEDTEINQWDIGLIPHGGFQFDQNEKEALITFLKLFDDESIATDIKFSDPFDAVLDIEDELIQNLIIKPNPMGEYSILELPEGSYLENTVLEVLDAHGKLVLSDKFHGTEYKLNKSNFSTGIYYIKIKNGNRISSHKLIVQ